MGQIFQETHGFTPLQTSLDAFVIETGQALIKANIAADSVLGGILQFGFAANWQWLPTIAARASPGGRVQDDAYARIKQHFLNAAAGGGFDAIALCLHGCMQTQSLDSAEADLLSALRAIVGPEIPIVAGFDLHGHAGGGMLDCLDFASAYKTNPHADARATGHRVARVLQSILLTGKTPIGVRVTVPMLTSGNDETGTGPMAVLHAKAAAALSADPQLLDVSVFNVNPFIDGAGVGQTVLVYAQHIDAWPAAQQLAVELAEQLWDARAQFTHQLPTLGQVLASHSARRVSSHETPGMPKDQLILGDFGDRVLAGGPGDSLYLACQLRRLAPHLQVVAPLTAPAAVQACHAAGIGARLTLLMGDANSRNDNSGDTSDTDTSVALVGQVTQMGDGTFVNRGTFMQGAQMRLGPYAVFTSGTLTLLLTTQPLMSQDPGCFLDAGVDLTAADVIVCKSGYHFKMAFTAWGTCVCVATPGLTLFDPTRFDFHKARPLYPLDDITYQPQAVRIG